MFVCRVCGHNKKKTIIPKFKFVSSDIKKVIYKTSFNICLKCSCIQKNINKNYISNVNKIYENYDGFKNFKEIDQKKINDDANINSGRCELLFKKFFKKKKINKILDYGTSNGAMIQPFLNKKKIKIFATDIKNNLNKKIFNHKNFIKFFSIDKLWKANVKFDLITMIHVLEHLENPNDILERLSKKLEKTGIILIQIPNYSYNPYDLSVYDHVTHFDKYTISKLANNNGLEVVLINDNFLDGEYSIILKQGKTRNSNFSKKNCSYPKRLIQKLEKIILKSNKVPYLSILGSSISSLCIIHNYNKGIKKIYDEDISKLGMKFEGKKISLLEKKKKMESLFLPFYNKKLRNIRKRLVKKYNYNLIW